MNKGLALLGLVFAMALGLFAPAGSLSAQTNSLCFSEVPHCISGRFAEYWQQNGGLPVFGYPISAASEQDIGGVKVLVQHFERNRFELRPENSPPYDVLLGRLGAEQLQAHGRQWESEPKAADPNAAGCRYFAETGHSVCNQFLHYWSSHGLNLDNNPAYSAAESLALFGLPLTEATMEQGSDGQQYLTQWFERARFELHPEHGNIVLLGLLGSEQAAASAAPEPAADSDNNDPDTSVPESIYAYVEPSIGPRGTTFAAIAGGFELGEKIGVYITTPDQSVLGAPFQVDSDDEGISDIITFTTARNSPIGIYAITFEGVSSQHVAIAYVRVTE